MSYLALFSLWDFLRKSKAAFLCLLMVGLVLNPAKAQLPESSQIDFKTGLEAYANQWYAQAFELWSKAEPEQWSGDWCGYAAQAAWKSGKPAEAIRWAYRGLRVEPQHTALRQELKFMLSSQQLTSEMPLEPPQLFWQISIDRLGRWALVFLWLALALLVGHHLLPTRIKLRRFLPYVFGLSLVLSLAVFGLAWGRYLWMHRNEAVAAVSSVVLKDTPDNRGQEVQRLKAGQRVRLVEKQQEWYRVRLSNEISGWIRSEELLPILPESEL